MRLAVGILPLAALGLYALYESGISVYASIRMDLPPVYPAHFVALLSWPDRCGADGGLRGGRGRFTVVRKIAWGRSKAWRTGQAGSRW